MVQNLIRESKTLGINLIHVTAKPLWVRKLKVDHKHYYWTILTDHGTLKLTHRQMQYPEAFRQACLHQVGLLPNKIDRLTWDNVVRKFMAIIKTSKGETAP